MQEVTNRPGYYRVKRLIRRINNLCVYLDNKYSINRGGCCYVASVIAQKLSELEIEYTVLFDGEPEGEGCFHVWLKAEDIEINSIRHSVITSEENLSPEEILNIYNSNDWCSIYDIDLNTKIKKLFNRFKL